MKLGDWAVVDAAVGVIEFDPDPTLLVESVPFEGGVAADPTPTIELSADDEAAAGTEVAGSVVVTAVVEDAAVVAGEAVEHETAVGRLVTPFVLQRLMA